MVEIVPSILAGTVPAFRRRYRHVSDLSPVLHVDVMDGTFVASRSLSARQLNRLSIDRRVDLHCMTSRPADWITALYAWRIRSVILHVELGAKLRPVIAAFRSNRVRVSLAINPSTRLSRLWPWLHLVSEIQVMTVRPGYYRSIFLPPMLRRVTEIKRRAPRHLVSVDGGMSNRTVPLAVAAGARRLIVGSYLQDQAHPRLAYRDLRQLVRG